MVNHEMNILSKVEILHRGELSNVLFINTLIFDEDIVFKITIFNCRVKT